MPETVVRAEEESGECARIEAHPTRSHFTTFLELWHSLRDDGRIFLGIVAGSLLACVIYCLITSNVYEATARVMLRGAPLSGLVLDRNATLAGANAAPGQVQLETLANVFRSDQLAWRVIADLRLDAAPGMRGSFRRKFSTLNLDQPAPDAKAYLLDEFQRDLSVQTIPRTLVLEIRFRSYDGKLSAAVVNRLILAYQQEQNEERARATNISAALLKGQLDALKTRVDRENENLAEFQKHHGILEAPGLSSSGEPTAGEHSAALGEVDALSRELVSATTDRILLEAQYQAAAAGDPELVPTSNPRLGADGGGSSKLLEQLRAKRSELEQEQTQLRTEHGPNFPRIVEIHSQIENIDLQLKAEDAKLVKRFWSAWKTAEEREQMLRRRLADATADGLRVNEAAIQYAGMRQEANASHDVYVRAMEQIEEAGLAAGSDNSAISVIDAARQPVKRASPNLLVDLAITLFVAVWAGFGAVMLRRSLRKPGRMAAMLVLSFAIAHAAPGQAPTPSTSGLPTGVARIPQSNERRNQPDGKDAPAVGKRPNATDAVGVPEGGTLSTAPAAIGPGDLLEISEVRTPEMHASVRVSSTGSIALALAGEVNVAGMDETAASHAIEAALVERGMLLHPRVSVLVLAYAAQDVTVLGEVMRPGVYRYAVHHRLLDLISTASGLSQNAGRLVFITHREDTGPAQAVVLDPNGTGEHNPELRAGDTVQVSRAGLVYVVGDVIRPGGFPVDQVQPTTVVQALSLAWGPGQNAALSKAVLIREQPGGRTITSLNLKRMLRGQDPDIPIKDRDILFVPDSTVKNLWNRTMDSVIQSAAGVSIYAGLVYSQRF